MIAGVEAGAAYCGRGHVESQFHARPEFSLGLVPLGRGGERLLPLWLETKIADSLSRRAGDDAGLRRGDVRRLVADETRLLTAAFGTAPR